VESVGRAGTAEFVASFALTFVGAGAVIAQANGHLDLTGVALANGSIFAAMVSATARLSGGVVNPAVAVGLWVTGKLGTFRAAAYVVAELAGAAAGALLLNFLLPSVAFAQGGGAVGLVAGLPAGKGLLIEATATFLLVFAVFASIVDDRGPLDRGGGLTIGLVVAACTMAFGPWTGAAMNPARWFGPALVSGAWSDWWVWTVGPVAGGVVAAVCYWAAFLKDRETATP
jgi:aquaporin TIP